MIDSGRWTLTRTGAVVTARREGPCLDPEGKIPSLQMCAVARHAFWWSFWGARVVRGAPDADLLTLSLGLFLLFDLIWGIPDTGS